MNHALPRPIPRWSAAILAAVLFSAVLFRDLWLAHRHARRAAVENRVPQCHTCRADLVELFKSDRVNYTDTFLHGAITAFRTTLKCPRCGERGMGLTASGMT